MATAQMRKAMRRLFLGSEQDLFDPLFAHDTTLPEGKEYHVCFRCSSKDQPFVADRVKALEMPPFNLRCYFFDRDCAVGIPIADCIADSQRKSSVIVFVLSPDYLREPWSEYEIDMAVQNYYLDTQKVVTFLHELCTVPEKLKTVSCIIEARAVKVNNKIAMAVFTKGNLEKTRKQQKKSSLGFITQNKEIQGKYAESLAKEDHLINLCDRLKDEKEKLQTRYEEIQIKYEECSEHRDRLNHQIKQVTQSESNLQMKYARLIKANEELINEKAYLETIVKTMEGHAKTVCSLEEKITSQESCLLEKTQRILTLEASLSCATENAKKTDEIFTRLKPLQAIPGILSSRCEALSLQIADTTGKLDRVANSNSQLVDKMNTLVKAWDSFRSDDTSDEVATNTSGGETIPPHLTPYVQRLCNTVGPNWLDVGRALGLDGDQLQRIWADWGQYGMRELTVRVIECWCANSSESNTSLDVLKTAMGRLEINPFMVEPMSDDDRKRLRENYQLLIRDMMDVTHIEGYLRQAGILSAAAVDYVIYPNTSRKRIQRLLKILPFSGDRALPEFKGALVESGQTHLASALAGEQCSASQTDRNILVERLVANTNNDLNTSDFALVKGLQDKRFDDRKILDSILDDRLEAKKIDDREMFQRILAEILDAKRVDDRKIFESILDERLEAKGSTHCGMFQRILAELLDAKRVDDRKIFESILDERLEAKRSTDCGMFQRILAEFLEAKKNDDQTILERILDEGHAIKRGDDRKVLEKIDEILKPSVRASAEIKQIIYMLYEKWDCSMFLSAEWHETEL